MQRDTISAFFHWSLILKTHQPPSPLYPLPYMLFGALVICVSSAPLNPLGPLQPSFNHT